jgi:hypothetical protein
MASHPNVLQHRQVTMNRKEHTPGPKYAARLLSLPNEVILAILNQLPPLPRPRQKTLLALTATCKRIRPLARDQLLVQPVIDVHHVHLLVQNYLRYPELVNRANSLEFSVDQQQVVPLGEPNFYLTLKLVPDKACVEACYHFIKTTAISQKGKSDWIRDISRRYQRAYVGILLVMLPNLKELLLGTALVSHFGILVSLFHMNDKHDNEYVREVFEAMTSQLQCLETPLIWYKEPRRFSCSLQNLRKCTSLKHLTLPDTALMASVWQEMREAMHKSAHLGQAYPANLNPEARERLPKSLETLTLSISHNNSTSTFAGAVGYLLDMIQIFRTNPNMRVLTFYFHHHSTAEHFRKEDLPLVAKYATVIGVQVVVRVQDTESLGKALQGPPTLRRLESKPDVGPSKAELMVYETRGLAREIYAMREAAEAATRRELSRWPVRRVEERKALETPDVNISALERAFGRMAGKYGPTLHAVNRDDK